MKASRATPANEKVFTTIKADTTNDARTITVYYRSFTSFIELKWERLTLFGLPFVCDCVLRGGNRSIKPLYDAMESAYGAQEAISDSYEIRLRGTIQKRHYTREERLEYRAQTKGALEGGALPAWEWEIGDYEVLSLKKLHWAKDYLWLSLLNTLTGLLTIAGLLALIFGGIPSCIRNW